MDRRHFIVSTGAAALAAAGRADFRYEETQRMYGLIGRMTAVAGKRDELISVLLEDTGEMPGCLSYVVAKDPGNADDIWITEVWDSEESHKASLALPSVRAAIERGRPLIAGFDEHHATEPVGGYGL